jgi:hypothetical protein
MADNSTAMSILPSLLERIRGLERELRGETAEERHARLITPSSYGNAALGSEPLNLAIFPTAAVRSGRRADNTRTLRSVRGFDLRPSSSTPGTGEGPVVAYTRPGVKVCNAAAEPHSAPRWLTREEATRINEGEYNHLII